MSQEQHQQPPARELTQEEKLLRAIDKMAEELKKVLPKHMPADKFIRTVKTAIKLNPDLVEADATSLLGACMKAAQDGLLLDGREAALVIFSTKERGRGGTEQWIKKVQYMPMFQGVLKKLRNSGELATIDANVVYEKDGFDFELGDNARLIHKPFLTGDRGKATMVYAIAVLKDGSRMREVMTVAEVDQVRSCSKGATAQNGPWVKWWGEMAKKSVIRRLAKRLPSSSDIDAVFQHDDEGYSFAEVDDEPPATSRRKPRGAAAAALADPEPETQHDPDTGEVLDGQQSEASTTGGGQSLPEPTEQERQETAEDPV